MKPRRISSKRFRARCAEILRDVERSGRSIIITRNGKDLVRIEPAHPSLEGSILYCGDILSPTGEW